MRMKGRDALEVWRRYGPDALATADLVNAWYVAMFEGDSEAATALLMAWDKRRAR